jgi:hypothetical protein
LGRAGVSSSSQSDQAGHRIRAGSINRDDRPKRRVPGRARVYALSRSATGAEKPLPHKGPESFPSWTSPVRPRSPALYKGRDSSRLSPSAPPSAKVAAAIFQSRKPHEDAHLSLEKYEIRESGGGKLLPLFLPAWPTSGP